MAATSIKLPHLVVAVLAAHLLLSIASSSNGQQHHHHHWPAAGISGVHAEPAFLTALQKWIIHLMGSFAERRSRFLLTLGRLHPSLSKAALSLTRSERRRDNNNHHQHHYYYVESPAQALQQAQHYDNVGGAAAGPSANLSPPAVATSADEEAADEYELVDAYDSRPYYYEQTWINSPDGETADRGSSAAISSAINDQDQYQQQQQQPSSAGADDDEEHQGYVDLVEAFDARPFYYQQQEEEEEEQQQANGQVSHGGGGSGSRGKAAARRPNRKQAMRAAAYNEAVRDQQLAFLQQQLQLNAEGGFRSLPRWSLPHYLDVPLTNDWTQVSTGENENHQQPARGRAPNGAEITREYLHQAPQQKNQTNSTAGTDVGEETAVEEGVEVQYIYVTENGQEFPADAVEEVDDTHHHNHQHEAYHDDERRLQQKTQQQQGWIGVDQMTAPKTQQNDNRRYFLVPSGPAKVPQHFKTGASAAGHHHNGGQFAMLAGNQHAPFVPHHMLQFSGQGGNAWSPVDSSKQGQMTHVYYYDEYAEEPSPVGHRPHFPQYVSYSDEEYQDEEYNTEYATEESASVTEEIPTTSDSTVEGGSPLPEKRSNSSTTAEDSTTEQSPENSSYSAPQPADATQPVSGASAATVESPSEETRDPQLPAADEEQSTVDSGPAVTSIQITKPTGDKKTARGHSMTIDSPDLQAGLYNYLYPPPAPTKRNPKVHYLLEFDKRSK